MTTTYSEQIAEIAQGIFATMLGMDIYPVEANGNSDASDRLIAAIQIAGPATCSVVLELMDGAATVSAAAMMQVPPADVTAADERDVAAELVNMVGGNLKSLLPGPSHLSLPTVVTGREVELDIAGAAVREDVTFVCGAGILRVRRYERIEV